MIFLGAVHNSYKYVLTKCGLDCRERGRWHYNQRRGPRGPRHPRTQVVGWTATVLHAPHKYMGTSLGNPCQHMCPPALTTHAEKRLCTGHLQQMPPHRHAHQTSRLTAASIAYHRSQKCAANLIPTISPCHAVPCRVCSCRAQVSRAVPCQPGAMSRFGVPCQGLACRAKVSRAVPCQVRAVPRVLRAVPCQGRWHKPHFCAFEGPRCVLNGESL